MRTWILVVLGLLGLLVLALFLSPWPSLAVIRAIFDRGAAEASAKLEPHVPGAVTTQTVRYDANDPDALFDIHRPPDGRADAPTIVGIHGGGFVSGQRGDIANYARLLAGQGIAVINLESMIAPEATYPTPVRQGNQALAYLVREGAAPGINPQRLVLAGDSAGAQIAAQTAAVISNPAHARMVGITQGVSPEGLAGVLLYCGVCDISGLGREGGLLGWFLQSAGWVCSGKRHWREDPAFGTMSITPHITVEFPPNLSVPATPTRWGRSPSPWPRTCNPRAFRSKRCSSPKTISRHWATRIGSISGPRPAGWRSPGRWIG